MATVTGMTAEAIDQLMSEMVVSMRIDDNGQMIYKTRGGVESNAGPVVAPTIALEQAWPVGSVYIGTTPENPASILGVGVWVRHAKGRVLVSQDDASPEFLGVGQTGGTKTNTLGINNIPAHSHTMNHSHALATANTDGGSTMAARRSDNKDTTDNFGAVATYTGNTGSAGAASPAAIGNLQPYEVVYIWKRNS